MTDLIKLELTEEEAKLFVRFQKHYALVKLLEELGAFDVKNGSVEIHFDSFGGIGSVDKRQHYRP